MNTEAFDEILLVSRLLVNNSKRYVGSATLRLEDVIAKVRQHSESIFTAFKNFFADVLHLFGLLNVNASCNFVFGFGVLELFLNFSGFKQFSDNSHGKPVFLIVFLEF